MTERKIYITLRITWLFLCVCMTLSLQAQPKREFRAAWLTTVWAIDWPTTWGQSTATAASKQQQELYAIVDSLAAANMNAVYFQVRGFSDAMYNSKYEPWSKYLTGTRGQAPSYDPLQILVDYAHRKGIEVHAWMNPYRYATSSATYGTLDTDYANTHPDWLVSCGGITILNPCLPEVRERIAAVVADVVRNYDVDGIVFDDYFYQSGYKNSYDDEYYAASGTTLSRADWRRLQVNTMVAQVRDSIYAIKPYVSFGIGPAGIAGTSSTSASVYGVEPCPVGSDWQYNGIYSDPLAWYNDHLIDYMAPQCYWTIGSSNDYAQLSEWWSKMACNYGRHVYISQDLSGLLSDSTAVSGSKFHASEIVDQINLTRQYDMTDARGYVWYSLKTGIQTQGFIRHIRNDANPTPALVPQRLWHHTDKTLSVTGISRSGNLLKWTAPASNLRYAVYIIPSDSIGESGMAYSGRHLVGTTYSTSYILPSDIKGTPAVAVLDRYGIEYPVRTLGSGSFSKSKTVTQVYPQDNGTALLPCYFSWNPTEKADSYFFQLSKSADFSTIDFEYETADTTFFIGKVYWLTDNTTYYWRIRTRSINCTDTYSSIYAFSGTSFNITSPTDKQRDVSMTPTFTCDSVHSSNVRYLFEVASAYSFTNKTIIFSGESTVPHITITDSLTASTMYYVRATVYFDNVSAQSSIITFRTEAQEVPVPVIISPVDGDTIYGAEVTVEWQQQASSGFRIELSTSETFAGRKTKTINVDERVYTCTFSNVAMGDYYIRVRAVADNGLTESSNVVQVHVEEATAVENIRVPQQAHKVVENGQLYIIKGTQKYSILGTKL